MLSYIPAGYFHTADKKETNKPNNKQTNKKQTNNNNNNNKQQQQQQNKNKNKTNKQTKQRKKERKKTRKQTKKNSSKKRGVPTMSTRAYLTDFVFLNNNHKQKTFSSRKERCCGNTSALL